MKNIKFNLKDPVVSIEGFDNYFVSANGIVYSCVQSMRAFLSGGMYPVAPKEHNRGYWEVGLWNKNDDDELRKTCSPRENTLETHKVSVTSQIRR